MSSSAQVGSKNAVSEAMPTWRKEDAALLDHLAEKRAFSVLWASQAAKGSPPPKRGAVLVHLLRSIANGPSSIDRAAAGDASSLLSLLAPPTLEGLDPALVHAMAVYFDRIADTWESFVESASGSNPHAEEAAVHARIRSLAAWARLSEERAFLKERVRRVGGSSLDDGDAALWIEATPLGALDRVGVVARNGARELAPSSARALRVLRSVDDACRIAGVVGTAANRFQRRAESARAIAIDEAIAVIEAAIATRKASNTAPRALIAEVELFAKVWRWAGADDTVERRAVQEATPIGWEIYRAKDWDGLRLLTDPLMPMVESLERRNKADPARELAYAAGTAQMLVFRSDAVKWATEEWQLVERALAVCPTHRNARSSMAHLACVRANTRLDGLTYFSRADILQEAEALVTRAEQLFPSHSGIEKVRTRLDAAKRRGGIA